MKLLEAEEVKKNNKVFETSQRERVKKLNTEETILTKKFNDAKDKTEKGIQKLDIEYKEFEKSTQEKKKTLLLEVNSLESRRKDALIPIKDKMKKANELLRVAEQREIELDEGKKALKRAQEDLLEKLETITDKESRLAEEDIEIKKRKKILKDAEEKVITSQKSLSEAWAKYHLEVNQANKDLIRREKEVEDQKKANETVREQQEKRAKEQADHDRQIADRYGTLGRAIAEAEKKYNIKIK